MQDLSVLVIHNRYRQWGGEDTAVEAEIVLLRNAGHRVTQYTRDNSTIANFTTIQKASLSLSTTWDSKSHDEVKALIRQVRPDIAHCHNFLPLVSPSVYYACKSAGVPVVQTLHNYRLFCPAGTFFTNGRRCDKCARNITHAARERCYRNSRIQTATVAMMLCAHRLQGTWRQSVSAYLAPSQFCRDYFVAAGLPEDRVHLKPNFLAEDPGPTETKGGYALFVGRLSPEKGVLETIEAWSRLPDVPLLIAGEGPLYGEAQRLADRSGSKVQLLGRLDPTAIVPLMKGARFLVFPSRWYEPFGMALLEAAACGVPAIASRIGAIPEIVEDYRTGLLFDPDDFTELVERVWWAWTHPAEMKEMGAAARQLYLRQFTAERNYRLLVELYRNLLVN